MYYLDGMTYRSDTIRRRREADERRRKKEEGARQLQAYLYQDYLKRMLIAAEGNEDAKELQAELGEIKKEALRSRLSDPDKVNVARLIDETMTLVRAEGGREHVINELRNVLYPQQLKTTKPAKRFGQRTGLQVFLVFITGGAWLLALPVVMFHEYRIGKKESK